MTASYAARGARTQILARPAELLCFALLIANVTYLAASYWHGLWIVGHDGQGIESDFVNVYAAGKLALFGDAASAYDWMTHKATEDLAVGHVFDGYFGWHYPPMFLFVAAVLALVPYSSAYLLWVFGTFPLYLVTIRQIVGERAGYLLAAAFPAILSNFIVGQNGFLTAGLMGLTLLYLPARPLLAGILLGVLTYKPHFGLLFPIVLAASGQWRAFGAAAVTAAVLALLSTFAFGFGIWPAFFASIPQTSQAFLSDGWANFGKLQTAFGFVRAIGGSEMTAWTVQALLALLMAYGVSRMWRRERPYEIKAAALATGTMLATPYLYTYDLVVLAVPLAFLIRLGLKHGFFPHEPYGIALVAALILAFPFFAMPLGFAAVLLTAAMVVRRARLFGRSWAIA